MGITICLLLTHNAEASRLDSYADIIEQSKKSVVNLRSDEIIRRDEKFDIKFFYGNDLSPIMKPYTPLGSAIIYDTRGHLVTSYTAIMGAKNIKAYFPKEKKSISVKVVAADRRSNVALLKLASTKGVKIRPAQMANSSGLKAGDNVLSLGNPFGQSYVATMGMIASTGNIVGGYFLDNFLNVDLAKDPGSNGGPLLDSRGRVVGLNALAQKTHSLHLATPSNQVKKIVKDLMTSGKVSRSWMGLVGENIVSTRQYSNDPNVHGVIVNNLIVGSPAQAAGMKIGDLVMQIDGDKVSSVSDLRRILSSKKPGTTVTVKLYRRNEGALEVNLSLAETPSARNLPSVEDIY